jgi:parallel beta-helix repeat protein
VKITTIILVAITIAGLVAGASCAFQSGVSTVAQTTFTTYIQTPSVQYKSHDPIHIDNDSQLNASNGVTGGNGTLATPYIIDEWDINASATTGIIIGNTSAHIVLRNCIVRDGGSYANSGIMFYNVTNARIDSIEVRKCSFAIYLNPGCNNITVYNNNVTGNSWGIFATDSTNITLAHNRVSSNDGNGMAFNGKSHTIYISFNDIGNCYNGIFMASPGNVVAYNNITGNFLYGITISSAFNRVVRNNFIGNHGASATYDQTHVQANDTGSGNNWTLSDGGNYWSDWTGPDSNQDGFVDSPYAIDGNIGVYDTLPLAKAVFVPEHLTFVTVIAAPAGAVFIIIAVCKNKKSA